MATTFELLSTTANEAAVEVLIRAIDSSHRSIQEGVLGAILQRKTLWGQREVLRRLHHFALPWRSKVDEHSGWMSQALRDAVLGTDLRMCVNGCKAAMWFREFDLIPVLLTAVEDEANPYADLAAVTLLALIDLLNEELAGPRDYRRRRDPQLVRRNVTTSLETSVLRFSKHKRVEVLEAFLAVANRENSVLQAIVHDPFHPAYLALVEILQHSERLGVVRLILSFLDDPQAPLAVLNVLGKRCDRRFVLALLRRVSAELGPQAVHNLKRVGSIVWALGGGILDQLDDVAQQASVKLVMASGMKRSDSFRLLEHLILEGTTGGRRAASAALEQFAGNEANTLVLRALEDDDAAVQANALAQIRHRGIPGALPRLIDALDSPHEVIQQTARASLQEFTFPRFLAAFDTLDEQVRFNTGALVRKVDPRCLPQLLEELAALSRTRRLRGLDVAMALRLGGAIEDQAIRLLNEDEDYLVRVHAARALSQSSSARAMQALSDAQALDRSAVVREAAGQSLEAIADRVPEVPSDAVGPPPVGGAVEAPEFGNPPSHV